VPKLFLLASEFPPGPGGIGTHAHEVAVQLSKRGWTVEVAAPQDLASDDAIEAFNREQPFVVHRIRRFGSGITKLAHRAAIVSKLIRAAQPDVIVGSGERMVWLAAAMHVLHRRPLVAVGHAMEFNRTPAWEYALTKRSFEAALGSICVSKYTWSRMEACGIRARGGGVIPNGASSDVFHLLPESDALAFKRERGLVDASLLITVGSVHERKGQDVVIRALPKILERIPNAHYLIVGMPYERDRFHAIASELGVASRVHFLGKLDRDELVRALNAADLFVMTSKHTAQGDFEGFGIAVVEAALCGCPAVVSGNSGVVEAIRPGVTGLVAQMGDPASTAEQIIAVLEHPDQRLAMGRRAREHALSGTWDVRADEYDRMLRELLHLPPWSRDGRLNTQPRSVH
jgi:phosphatidylinositol alpha-1,6-mannosyltransferase